MGKHKRKKTKAASSPAPEQGNTFLEIFEAEGMMDPFDSNALKRISKEMREYPEPEPAFLPPIDGTGAGAAGTRELSLEELRRIRKRVELLEDISPLLRAGDEMIKISDEYVKAGEGRIDRVFHEHRRGIFGRLFPPVKVSHPNHFKAVHVEALPNIFKKLN
jgi:hypothetical protein